MRGWEKTCVLFLKKEASLLAGIPDGSFRYVPKQLASHNSLDVDQKDQLQILAYK